MAREVCRFATECIECGRIRVRQTLQAEFVPVVLFEVVDRADTETSLRQCRSYHTPGLDIGKADEIASWEIAVGKDERPALDALERDWSTVWCSSTVRYCLPRRSWFAHCS